MLRAIKKRRGVFQPTRAMADRDGLWTSEFSAFVDLTSNSTVDLRHGHRDFAPRVFGWYINRLSESSFFLDPRLL